MAPSTSPIPSRIFSNPREMLLKTGGTLNNAAGATGVKHDCPGTRGHAVTDNACWAHRGPSLWPGLAWALASPLFWGLASGRPGSQLLPRSEPVSPLGLVGVSPQGRGAGRAFHLSPHFEKGAAEAERGRDRLSSHERTKRPRTTFLESNGSSRRRQPPLPT